MILPQSGPFDDDLAILVAGQSPRSPDSYIRRSQLSTQATWFTRLSRWGQLGLGGARQRRLAPGRKGPCVPWVERKAGKRGPLRTVFRFVRNGSLAYHHHGQPLVYKGVVPLVVVGSVVHTVRYGLSVVSA